MLFWKNSSEFNNNNNKKKQQTNKNKQTTTATMTKYYKNLTNDSKFITVQHTFHYINIDIDKLYSSNHG